MFKAAAAQLISTEWVKSHQPCQSYQCCKFRCHILQTFWLHQVNFLWCLNIDESKGLQKRSIRNVKCRIEWAKLILSCMYHDNFPWPILGGSCRIQVYLNAKSEGDKNHVSKNEHESKFLSNDVPPADFIACLLLHNSTCCLIRFLKL
jgi:hypothetical protein